MSGLSYRTNMPGKKRSDDKKQNKAAPRFELELKNKPLNYFSRRESASSSYSDSHLVDEALKDHQFDFSDPVMRVIMGENLFKTQCCDSEVTQGVSPLTALNEEPTKLINFKFSRFYPFHLPQNHPHRMEFDRQMATLFEICVVHPQNQSKLEKLVADDLLVKNQMDLKTSEFESKSESDLNRSGSIWKSLFEYKSFHSNPSPVCRCEPLKELAAKSQVENNNPPPPQPRQSSPSRVQQLQKSPQRYKNGKIMHTPCCSFCHGKVVERHLAIGIKPPSKDAYGEYSTHPCMENGIVVCPVLRKVECGICGATGDRAHTTKYHLEHVSQCT